jgi:hypothetical protein
MPRRSLTALLLVAAALSSTGCALHIHRDPAPPPGFRYEPAQAATTPFAAFERGPVELSEPFDRSLTHDFLELSYPSSGRNGHPDNRVEGRYLRARETGRKPLVVVLPIWGTSDYPPQKISTGYARRARQDAHVVWLYGNAPLFPWDALSTAATEERFAELARDSAERYRSAVVDLRRLIDWAGAQPEIDASRIAVVGFSMSALVTATLLANEPRVSAAVLMMGAANFADVFSRCGNRAGEVRDHVLRSFGWSIEQYHDFFAGLFDPADPSQFEGRYDPDKILMIDAMFDDCMPESSRAALWEVTGHPARITFLYRHRSAFYSLTPLGLNVSRRQIYRFLDDALFERRR